MKQIKVLAVASAGGHWKQLTRLRPAFASCLVVYVCTMPQSVPVGSKFYLVPDANRRNLFPFLWQIGKSVYILMRERPDAIVTTGAAPGLIAIVAGRLFGIRGVWIDSFANVETLSLSGRLVKRFAVLHLTQWPHLAGRHGPKFVGNIL